MQHSLFVLLDWNGCLEHLVLDPLLIHFKHVLQGIELVGEFRRQVQIVGLGGNLTVALAHLLDFVYLENFELFELRLDLEDIIVHVHVGVLNQILHILQVVQLVEYFTVVAVSFLLVRLPDGFDQIET